jgi:uncharacterized LabA/DUF88 family protein
MNAKNFAYIDGANLHRGIKSLGWELDYARFRIWLKEKYSVESAYIFIGLIAKYKDLYTALQKAGYILVFKETIFDGDGKVKGNCDADLVLHAVRDTYESSFDRTVIVSSDGDYSSLVLFLKEKNKMHTILSPRDNKKCSLLLKRTGVPISYINDQRLILEALNEKTPDADGTA